MTTLKFNSKVGKRITRINKDLGVTILRDSLIQFTSTPIGLYIQIQTNNGILRFYDKSADIISDGSAIFLYMDIVDAIFDDEMSLDIDDNLILFNTMPMFESESNNIEDIQVIGNKVLITAEQNSDLLTIFKKYKSELKKSIFEESTEMLLEIKDSKLNILLINPLRFNKIQMDITDNSQHSRLYLNKQNIKILETMFNKKSFEIIFGNDIIIRNKDLDYILEKKILNMSLFYPTFKK